jgi:uncharacterized membrane protein YoaK (UPF0700 family)
MFLAQAHSFVQQARLAITLAWVSGCTNILTVLTCGQVTSHVTGTTSNLGHDLVDRKWGLVAYALFLLTTFFCGAALSGFMTELGRRKHWESIYVLPMAVETLLLAAFAIGVRMHDPAARETGFALYLLTGIASTAMGLQNATITRISGGVVRTTHTTGTLTDLGLETAQFLLWMWDRRRDVPAGEARSLLRSIRAHPSARRLVLLASIIGSFALGAAVGTIGFENFPHYAMFPPVLFLLWIIYQDIRRPIAELEQSELMDASSGLNLPDSLAVYHIRRDARGRPGIHRMPNLLLWADRLPARARIVVLDLTDMQALDDNAALEIRATLSKASSGGRHMILAGLSPEQFDTLSGAPGYLPLDPHDACPDLDLAIARGLNVALEKNLVVQ